jgi:hypothetical protein
MTAEPGGPEPETPAVAASNVLVRLGVRSDELVLLDGRPPEPELDEPAGVRVHRRLGREPYDVMVCFAPERAVLDTRLPMLVEHLRPDGSLWVAWPQLSSTEPTDLSEEVVRDVANALGLVGDRVSTIDEDWLALRLLRTGGDSSGTH